MNRLFGYICVALLLAGMAGCGKKYPDDIIQPDEMENLLYDYHLASVMTTSLPYDEAYKKDAYFQYVFRKHRVTEADFDSSMVWYTRHGDELAEIYTRLQKRFEEDARRMKVQVAKRDNQILVSMSGDTVDVWQDRTLYWLTPSMLTNKILFDLKADTSFRTRDAMVFTADFRFMPEVGRGGGRAVMGLNFYFDNDSVQGITRAVTASGPQRLYLRPDSAFTIRNISGFVYYTNDKDEKGSLLVNDIRLTRYHMKEKVRITSDTLSHTGDTVKTRSADTIVPLKVDTLRQKPLRVSNRELRVKETR